MNKQTTFEDIEAMLDEIAAEIPQDIYKGLNGGIILLPNIKPHPLSKADDLFILGEYHVQPHGLGRYIAIYYGSFIKLYGHLGYERQRKELRSILFHEFLHHLESLAGERGLEIKDAIELEKYKRNKNSYQ